MRRSVKGVYDNVGWLAYFRKRFRSILRLDGIAFPAYNPKIYSSKVFGHLVVFPETREVTGSNLFCLVSNMSPYTSFLTTRLATRTCLAVHVTSTLTRELCRIRK